ncbi:MAG: hypothetical protein M3121_00930 [Chloroflexota bacterium]|nr:hypothetical protein [Chloroflexota bacterium]
MLERSPRRGNAQTMRSQLATELLLNAFAAVAVVIVMRLILVLLDISDRIWIGALVYGLTDPVVDLLARIPGATRPIVAELTLAEMTLASVLILFPLGIMATARAGRR